MTWKRTVGTRIAWCLSYYLGVVCVVCCVVCGVFVFVSVFDVQYLIERVLAELIDSKKKKIPSLLSFYCVCCLDPCSWQTPRLLGSWFDPYCILYCRPDLNGNTHTLWTGTTRAQHPGDDRIAIRKESRNFTSESSPSTSIEVRDSSFQYIPSILYRTVLLARRTVE